MQKPLLDSLPSYADARLRHGHQCNISRRHHAPFLLFKFLSCHNAYFLAGESFHNGTLSVPIASHRRYESSIVYMILHTEKF